MTNNGTNRDAKSINRSVAMDAMRNCPDYGPAMERVDTEIVEAGMLAQEVAVSMPGTDGEDRPLSLPTPVAFKIAKALRVFYMKKATERDDALFDREGSKT